MVSTICGAAFWIIKKWGEDKICDLAVYATKDASNKRKGYNAPIKTKSMISFEMVWACIHQIRNSTCTQNDAYKHKKLGDVDRLRNHEIEKTVILIFD